HTRSDRDWSSDVCSSDLRAGAAAEGGEVAAVRLLDPEREARGDTGLRVAGGVQAEAIRVRRLHGHRTRRGAAAAACREERERERSEERRVGKECRVGGTR